MTSKRDTSPLKSISGLDIPNWTTFQMYVFAFANSVINFICTWKKKAQFSKNGLKSKSGWK